MCDLVPWYGLCENVCGHVICGHIVNVNESFADGMAYEVILYINMFHAQMVFVRGQPVFHSENILEFFQLQPWTPLVFFGLQLPLSSRDALEYFHFRAPSSSPQHYHALLLL